MSADTSDQAAASGSKARKSSSYPGVMKLADLEAEGKKIEVAPETQRLGWKLNTSPNSIDDPTVLKKPLTNPPVNKVDLVFPLGMSVTARNMKGVQIKDALDAIHKQYKKKADDELGEEPYLKGFEYDTEESWTSLKVHLTKQGLPPVGGGKKKKAKGGDDE